jgi:protein-S-isoprenylcysteine O-methyltransferase Ste14
MYVAWTTIYVGMILLVNSGWLLIFLPVLLGFTHYVVIRREEQQLEQHFGSEYRQYRDRVRRYL